MSVLGKEEQRISSALLIVRIAVGIPFIFHGLGILFGVLGGPGIAGFATFTHMPQAVAFLVGLAELAGGLAVLFGVLARLGAACIMIVMIGAIFLVHAPKGYDIAKGGMEYALTQFLAAGAILIAGAGSFAVARAFQRPSPTVGTPELPGRGAQAT